MNKLDYNYKLQESLNKAIEEHVQSKDSLNINGYQMFIDKVDYAASTAKLENIKFHELLSGKDIEINVDVKMRLFEKRDNTSSNRDIQFWVRPAKVNFDHESESFKVIDVSKLLAFNFL